MRPTPGLTSGIPTPACKELTVRLEPSSLENPSHRIHMDGCMITIGKFEEPEVPVGL